MNCKKIMLYPDFFSEKEKELCFSNSLRATIFRYSTGVCAVKIENKNGFAVLLPYQGQQIWRAEFLNHPLTMKTAFCEPKPVSDFLETYGAFLLHCGITSMGNPSDDDTHPQHGELPNAHYNIAWISMGEDEKGSYIEVSGLFRYIRAFEKDYCFIPSCRLYEDATTLHITASLQNNRKTPLEYYYLCHINFIPVDGSELFYTADKNSVTVHHDIPEDFDKKEILEAYMKKLDKEPELHHKIGEENQIYNPEIVFTIKYKSDSNGKAHTIQMLPDGHCFYVNHLPSELPYGLRWISRTEDEDSLGMVLPATAEHKGLKYCRKNGYDRYLEPQGKITFHMEAGILPIEAAQVMKEHIEQI